jgi:hypothetical protein
VSGYEVSGESHSIAAYEESLRALASELAQELSDDGWQVASGRISNPVEDPLADACIDFLIGVGRAPVSQSGRIDDHRLRPGGEHLGVDQYRLVPLRVVESRSPQHLYGEAFIARDDVDARDRNTCLISRVRASERSSRSSLGLVQTGCFRECL